ncbi:hypothetical protein FA15DRAFT_452192 [Coprinopsis marcescibilis]|uniref:Uncharacterized protein n=1 Tax=Coprinopsis marcescibilis TaxID=230819 RepID=A0A5C3KT06_COPMA|nr:hypothetical protein FA15DRAFT_452192 [Coprinopsis marcescibilis]
MTRYSQGSMRNPIDKDDSDSRSFISGSSSSRSSSSSTLSHSTDDSSSTATYTTRSNSHMRDSRYSGSTDRTGSSSKGRSSTSSIAQAEIRELEDMIFKFRDQLENHKQRADAQEQRANMAERHCKELAEHLKKMNDARLVAQQEANKANEELRLYKLQLEYAQREIYRAQEVMGEVDKQRYDAEKQASEARARARRLNEELIVEQARRQGRQQGLQEGLQRGRTLTGPDAARPMAGDRSSYLDRASFMEDDDNDDYGDARTLSSGSSRTRSVLSSRPQSISTVGGDTEPVPSPPPPASPSPPPVPIPQPRTASEAHPERTPSLYRSELPPNTNYFQPSRPHSRAPSISQPNLPPGTNYYPSPLPHSRAASISQPMDRPPDEHYYEQDYRPRSRAGSIAQSDIRPPSFRNPSPTPRMMPVQIPPDNLIPVLDPDGKVRLPPPYEFNKVPTNQGRSSPIQFSQSSLDRQPQRQYSLDTASTTISQFEITRDVPPQAAITPALSIINEINSRGATPNSMGFQAPELGHQRSMSAISGGSNQDMPFRAGSALGSILEVNRDRMSAHTRSPAGSIARSLHSDRPPSVRSTSGLSKQGSSVKETPINISVLPPVSLTLLSRSEEP